MELFDQLGKYPEIQFTLCITFKWCLEREMSCRVLEDGEDILRLHNFRFITLDLLMSYISVIIIKEITTVKGVSNLLGCYALSTGKYRRLRRV